MFDSVSKSRANRKQTRDDALKIEQRMNEEHHKVACLTGQFEGYQRDIIIDSFRDGRTKVLITTNVLARGIDVQTVSLVVNYVGLQMSTRPIPRYTTNMFLGCTRRWPRQC